MKHLSSGVHNYFQMGLYSVKTVCHASWVAKSQRSARHHLSIGIRPRFISSLCIALKRAAVQYKRPGNATFTLLFSKKALKRDLARKVLPSYACLYPSSLACSVPWSSHERQQRNAIFYWTIIRSRRVKSSLRSTFVSGLRQSSAT